jgi:hypothetical protein
MCVVHCTSMNSSTIIGTMDMTVKLGITLQINNAEDLPKAWRYS